MTEKDFVDYLNKLKEDEIKEDETTKSNRPLKVSPISKSQRHYYDNNTTRYIYLMTTYMSVDGHNRDNSIVSVGSNHSTYPARVMTSCNAQITNYSTQVYISYVYDYYLSAYITDGVYRTAYITFSVSGGDIYG